MAEKKKANNKKNSGIGLALWTVAALILLILFIKNSSTIIKNLKTTGFFEKLGTKTPSVIQNASVPEEPVENDVQPLESVQIDLTNSNTKSSSDSNLISQNEKTEQQQQKVAREKSEEKEKNIAEKTQAQEIAKKADEEKVSEKEKSAQEKKESTPAKTEAPVPEKTMSLKLYYMAINADGSVARKEVTRAMKKSDSPLVDAVNALIQGPNVSEENLGCRTLISNGTRLIGASVKDGTATLNFSGEFEFNQYGIEGTRGQLQQIVFTATAFPTVSNVQFLIDGEKRDYLGSEGVWIGSPLSRNSF